MLWGLGVGYVISGMYFGWNLGLIRAGSLGLAIATGIVIIMYITFTLGYAELACAIPRAGGAFDYAERALGKKWGFFAGMVQNIEFIFAPPAIAFAIGSYMNKWFPSVPVIYIAMGMYVLFTLINIRGIKFAGMVELIITLVAVGELIIFAVIALSVFKPENLTANPLPAGYTGIFSAFPFAIWFFLGIEGIANVAEETRNPQKNILRGFLSAIITLVILCILTFIASVGVKGWEAIVYEPGTRIETDSPLPIALSYIVGSGSIFMHMLIGLGIFGLLASFHGLLLAAGRSTYEFAKAGNAPTLLAGIHSRYKTPSWALLFNMSIGFIALNTGRTSEIITMACLGALALYMISMISLIVLRSKEPDLYRPFKAPGFPYSSYIAIIIAGACTISLFWYNYKVGLVFVGILLVSQSAFHIRAGRTK